MGDNGLWHDTRCFYENPYVCGPTGKSIHCLALTPTSKYILSLKFSIEIPNNFLKAMKLLEPDTQEKVVGHNAKEKKVDAVIVVKVDIVAEQDGQETDVMGRWARDSVDMFVPKRQQLVIINKKFNIVSVCDKNIRIKLKAYVS